MKRGFLLLTAFVCGGVIMGLELAASRLLAPTFGYSIYVWGSLLGVVMAALAAGYFMGGWLIDKSPSEATLYEVILAAFVLSALIPVYGTPFVESVGGHGMLVGSALATLLVFGFPMMLLAMVSPMIIRLKTMELSALGLSSGTIYAVSTVGSIAGTFASAFYLIPSFGTRNTVLVMAAVLLLVSLIGLSKKKYWPAAAVLLIVMLIPARAAPYVIYETESEYSLIKVVEYVGTRKLIVNQDKWIQTLYTPGRILTEGYWDYPTLGPALSDADTALVVGVAGGGSIRQMRYFYPNLVIDGVDIDGKIMQVAKEYFDLRQDGKTSLFVGDGRTFIRNSGKKYDYINVDAFGGGPNIPFYMVTREFFTEARESMNDGGVLMLNVLSINGYTRLSDVIANTVSRVFPSVYVINLGNNQIIVAFKNKTSFEEYSGKLSSVSGGLSPVARKALSKTRVAGETSVVLTDDHAPIEKLIQEMLSA